MVFCIFATLLTL